jgi:hypothetical protein
MTAKRFDVVALMLAIEASGCRTVADIHGAVGGRAEPATVREASVAEAQAPAAATPQSGADAGELDEGASGTLHLVMADHRLNVVHDPAAPEPDHVHICSVRGATMLCDGSIDVLAGGTFARLRVLTVGLPEKGYVVNVFGHWPDDAWLVWRESDLPPWHDSIYRWEADRWTVVKKAIPSWAQLSYLPWGPNAAFLFRPWDFDRGPKFEGLGSRRGWQSGRADLDGRVFAAFALAFADGSYLYVRDEWQKGGGFVSESWPARGNSPPVKRIVRPDNAESSVVVHGLWGVEPNDVVAFGVQHQPGVEDKSYLAHFDGRRWSREVSPALFLSAYVRDTSGRQWALSYDDHPNFIAPDEGWDPRLLYGKVWTAEPHSSWTGVDMPLRCRPYALWATDDGIWVGCWPSPEEAERRHVRDYLLSTYVPPRVSERIDY